MTMQIGLFYGSSTCYTEIAAEKIAARLAPLEVDLFNIRDHALTEALQYDILIFGISTWDYGELQEDWESCWDDVAALDLSGKIVALYGLGDQEGYGDWFVDALGMLHQAIAPWSPARMGLWPCDKSYNFTASKALLADGQTFAGLVLDDENQYDLTDQRIEAWCDQLKAELQLND